MHKKNGSGDMRPYSSSCQNMSWHVSELVDVPSPAIGNHLSLMPLIAGDILMGCGLASFCSKINQTLDYIVGFLFSTILFVSLGDVGTFLRLPLVYIMMYYVYPTNQYHEHVTV